MAKDTIKKKTTSKKITTTMTIAKEKAKQKAKIKKNRLNTDKPIYSYSCLKNPIFA